MNDSENPNQSANPPLLSKVQVWGLFERSNVELQLTNKETTLVYGANGAGKSTLLRIIYGALSENFGSLAKESFLKARLTFTNGNWVEIDKSDKTDLKWIEQPVNGKKRTGSISCFDPLFLNFVDQSTQYMVSGGKIIHPTTGQQVTAELVDLLLIKYRLESSILISRGAMGARRRSYVKQPAQEASSNDKREFVRGSKLVTSDRLRPIARDETAESHYGKRMRSADDHKERVDEVAHLIKSKIDAAIKHSGGVASNLDRNFFKRAFANGGASGGSSPATEEDRDKTIESLTSLNKRLRECALTSATLELPKSTQKWTQEVWSIYDIYLSDLLEKAVDSKVILQKLELLRDILNRRLTDKNVLLSADVGIEVHLTCDKGVVELRNLSSGEQHLIVLFYDMIFETTSGGICLIDEPEISLNVGWQKAFVADIEEVAKVSSQQYIIATHSPQIVNDRNELMAEIKEV